ncbi:MAG: hypothetical protein IIA45_03765 [Bacteroidetes bacterium]|nr:hypothetical protein [Bacteroidota bacterium]
MGEFGITSYGSSVASICGNDHLSAIGNRIFRHVFSVGDKITLEIRELYDEQGNTFVRIRDVDGNSESFGYVFLADIIRENEKGNSLKVDFKVLAPETQIEGTNLNPKIDYPLTEVVSGLIDLSSDLLKLGVEQSDFNVAGKLLWGLSETQGFDLFGDFASKFQAKYPKWHNNLSTYLAFGHFRDKCCHDGTNLVGSDVSMLSDYIPIRSYRMSLTVTCALDTNMLTKHRQPTHTALENIDTWGIYSPFLLSTFFKIKSVKQGLDKVHSAYWDEETPLKPGSWLETGIEPVINSQPVNDTIAIFSAMVFEPQFALLIPDLNVIFKEQTYTALSNN